MRRLLPLSTLFSADDEVVREHPVEIDKSKVESDMASQGVVSSPNLVTADNLSRGDS